MAKKKTLFSLANSQRETLQQMEGYFTSLEQYFNAYNEILGQAAKMLIPLVRKELLHSLANSDLNMNARRSKSNKTTRLATLVANSVVYTSPKAINITMPRGYSEEDYQKANALEYGALRGSKLKNSKSRQTFRRSMEANGRFSTVVRTTDRNGQESAQFITRTRAHPYYGLTSGQLMVINAAFVQNVQTLIDKKMAALGKKVS